MKPISEDKNNISGPSKRTIEVLKNIFVITFMKKYFKKANNLFEQLFTRFKKNGFRRKQNPEQLIEMTETTEWNQKDKDFE